jgi:hypothetical protein
VPVLKISPEFIAPVGVRNSNPDFRKGRIRPILADPPGFREPLAIEGHGKSRRPQMNSRAQAKDALEPNAAEANRMQSPLIGIAEAAERCEVVFYEVPAVMREREFGLT